MAGQDLDHQFPVPGPQPVPAPGPQPAPAPVARRKPRPWIPAPHGVRASSPSWMARGACRGEDPELFFPIAATAPALQQVRMAKAVCARCPVQANCLSYALVTGQNDGIWGGTTREERWPARRLRRRPPAEPARS